MYMCQRTDLNSSSKFVGISSPVEKTLNGKIQFQPRIRFRTACHRHEPSDKLLASQFQVFSQIEDNLSAIVRRSLPPPEQKYHSMQHTHSKPTHKTKLHIQAGVTSLTHLVQTHETPCHNNQFRLHLQSRTVQFFVS